MRGYDVLFQKALLVHAWGGSASCELCFLPDKVARFLFEFHADDYKSLGLLAIPTSASSGDIHKLLKTPHACI
jgi:hypothetical protein